MPMRHHSNGGMTLPLISLGMPRRALVLTTNSNTGSCAWASSKPFQCRSAACLFSFSRSRLFSSSSLLSILQTAALYTQRRMCASHGSNQACIPKAPSARARELPNITDMPPPPRPAFYIPPEERDASDESLAFMKSGSPLKNIRAQHETLIKKQRAAADTAVAFGKTVVEASEGDVNAAELHLAPGQMIAPHLQDRLPDQKVYMDEDGARLQSTSVHAGHSLLRKCPTLDTSDYYYTPKAEKPAAAGRKEQTIGLATPRRVLHKKNGEENEDENEEALLFSEADNSSHSTEKASPLHDTIFSAKYEHAKIEDAAAAGDGAQNSKARSSMANAQQMRMDIKKLEYYYGTPQYPELLKSFQQKYGDTDPGDTAADAKKRRLSREYTEEEIQRGLEEQPVDYFRTSQNLQSRLASGPHAYNPTIVLQQHGIMRHQGYAFPPTVELGKLKDVSDFRALQDTHKRTGVVASVRRSFNALIGHSEIRDTHLAEGDRPKEDTHLVNRLFGLDAVQRRQMRFMLSDFDYQDRNTAFHVMMSYPYTDWLHVFYMVLVGWALYQLQVRYGAYEFYDEYLGLDLRQVPSLQKPMLCLITVTVMVAFLFQPLLIASIGTTRAYRILMRRPIGPP